jgi:hypothetical protein
MTDINNQNLTSDHNGRQASSQSVAVPDYPSSVQLPVQAVGTLVDPLGVSKQSKGKRRGKKVAPTQQDLAYADGQEQSANAKGEDKASGGGGGSSLLYVVGGLAVVGAGLALAGGSGSSPTPEPPKDTTAPTAPTVSLPTDTGSSSTDRITSNGRIDVGGLETGATWEYSTNGGTSWQSGSGTSFTLSAGTYADGSVLVRQKDTAGNVSATGKPAGAVTVDATAPSVATIAQVAGDGTVSAAEKAAGVTLSGTGEAGSSVSVVWGTVTKTATVNASGAWSVQFASTDVPADGATTVRVTLTDLAGNASTEAQRAVTVDTKVLIQGNIVAGPLVAGQKLTVSIFTSTGTLLESGVPVANDGSFSIRVSAKLGDVLIAKVIDSDTGADYLDEATGAAKDLNAALFAAVIVSDLSAPIQAQVNPVTTLAAIKAGLSADGSGTISNADAVLNANTLVAKALGLDNVNVAPVPTNGGSYAPSDGLSSGEKLGAVLAALSGLDSTNEGNSQTSLTFLAAQIGVSGQALSAEGQAALLNGALAASLRTDGKLEAAISNLLAATQQSVDLSIASVASDNVVSASELNGLVLTGTVATGATSVVLSLGSWTANATITDGTWSYALSASDASSLGADGAKILVATAVLGQGQSVTSSRAILLDTAGPVATINMISGNDVVNVADKLAGVVISGTAEAKSSILLTWGGVELSTQADLAGVWTLTVPSAQVPATGNTTVSVVATDVNNNAGQAVTRNVSVDTTPPTKPTIDVLSQDDVLGAPEVVNGVVLTGVTDPGVKVLLSWGSGTQYSAFANDLGAWTITIPVSEIPAPGVRSITVQAEDSVGNLSDNATRDVTLYGALTAPVILPVMGDDLVNAADSANGIALKGLAPANALVRIVWGSATATVEADPLGNWTAQFDLADLPADGNTTITATIVDVSGAAFGSSSRPVVIDTTSPDPVLINTVAQNNVVNALEKSADVVVSGTAEAGSKVDVNWGLSAKSTNASSSGVWTVTFAAGDVPADGSTTIIQARATDSVGNISPISTLPITIDSGVPLTPNVSLEVDTGQSPSDQITKNGNFRVLGVESGASWSYSSDGGASWEPGSGTTFLLDDGKYAIGQIRVRQTDAAENESVAYSNATAIQIDTGAEDLVIDDVASNNVVNLADKTAGVTVTGMFEAGSSVVVTWGSVVKTVAPVGADGKWAVTFLSSEVPADGSRSISVTATDVAGNSITPPATSITIDTDAPSALGLQLSDTGSLDTDGVTKDGTVNISNLESNGDWEYSINSGETWSEGSETSFGLLQGVYEANTVLVRQKDAAGNIGASSPITKKLVVDTSALGLSISQVANDGVVNIAEQASGVAISGFAEANASVLVTWGAVSKTVNAGQDGAWSVDYLPSQVPVDGQYDIQAVQTDIAGNVSDGVIRLPVSVDTVRPSAPQIAAVSTNDIVNGAEKQAGVSVSGTAVANGKVVVQWGSASKTVDADGNGNWSALFSASDIPADGSTAITATVTNGIGNTSVASLPRTVLIDTIVAAPSVATVSGDGRVNAAEKTAGVTVSGLAEANSTVAVGWGTKVETVSSNQAGQWSANFSSADIPSDGSSPITSSITVSVTDAVGNKSNEVNTPVVIDTRAPDNTQISAIAGDDIVTLAEKTAGVVVSGRAEARAVVTATFGGRSETVNADAAGNWSATFASTNVPADGDQLVTVTATDAAGNISATASRLITVATAQTSAPVIAVIAGDNVVGASEKAAGVRVSGVAVADSAVIVAWGSNASKTVTANAQGSWTTSFGSAEIPADGAYTVTATANGVTGSRQVNVDATPPAAPTLVTAAAAQNLAIATGSSGAVTVSAEVGSSILVVFTTANGTISKPLTATGATQAVVLTANDLTALGDGIVNVSATAREDVSGSSQISTASFVIDTVAPAAAQLSVVATDQVVDILEQAQGVTFAGTAEANAQVVVQWGASSKTVNANGTGAWSAVFTSAQVPADGARTATITVSDAANNVASSTATVQVAATPYMALTKGAELIVTKDIFALSANEVSATSTSITISGLTNGAFRKGGLVIRQFTLKDVQDGLVTFVHDNSVNAPTFNVAVSDGTISSVAKAAQIFFVPTSLSVNLDDSLTGTTGSDLLIGGYGNDTIRGGQGNDVLYGLGSGITQGLDNDIFVWGSGDAGLGATDVIRDFTAWNGTSGDKLDLTALLVGYQAGTSDISQWISVQNGVTLPGATGWDVGKTGTLLTIDIDGAGAGTVTQTIFLENVSLTTTNPNQLISGGVILA